MEQQHQHAVNAQHADQHGNAETGKQGLHFLRVAELGNLHAGGQVLQAGQGARLGVHVAQLAAAQLHVQRHVAVAIQPVNLRRAAFHREAGHHAEQHRAVLARHRQALQSRQVGAHGVGQLDADRHLALRQIEFGQAGVVVARRCHAHGLADAGGRHTEVGGARGIGPHNDLGPHQRGAGADVAHALQGAQFALHFLRARQQGHRVFALQHQLHLDAGIGRADGEAGARDVGQLEPQLRLDVRHRCRPVIAVGGGEREHGAACFGRGAGRKGVAAGAAANRAEHAFDVRSRHAGRARLLGHRAGLGQRAAGRQLNVDLRLGAVRGRHKAGRQQRHQRDRGDEEEGRSGHGDGAVAQAPAHGRHVVRHQPAVGRLSVGRRRVGLRRILVRLQKVGRHHGREQARHHQRGQNRKHRGPAKLLEEQARHAAHEGGRQEHRHQREGGGDHRHADFVRRFHGGLVGRFAHAQMALDVFDLHNRVVHQHADHQGKRQQRHGVERVAEILESQERRDHRQRQRGGRHQRGAPVAQKPPHHQNRQQRALQQQLHGTAEVLGHRLGVVDHLRQADGRVPGLQFRHGGAHPAGDLHFAGALGAKHLEADHAAAVLRRHRARLGHRVQHRGHLVEPEVAAVRHRDVEQRQLGRGLDGGDGAHRLFGATDIAAATGRFLLHQLQAARDIDGGHVQGRHLVGIELDPHFAADAADPLDGAHARHAEQALGHRVVDKPAQGLVIELARAARGGGGGGGGHGRRGRREGQHHAPGGRGFGDGRVAQVGRQVSAHPRHGVAHVVDGLGNRLFQDELDRDLDIAVEHLGVDVLDTLQRRHRVFDLARHFGFQLRRGHARQGGADGDDGQLDVGEVLHRAGAERQDARQREQHKQHDGRYRVLDGERGEVHACSLFGSWCRRFDGGYRHI